MVAFPVEVFFWGWVSVDGLQNFNVCAINYAKYVWHASFLKKLCADVI
jgi:hypothetical protein